MGKKLIDQYSFLHFSTGCIAYFFGITLFWWIIIHTLFEIIENSPKGVRFIDTHLKFWPGGKKSSDNLINSISDLIFAIIGYLVAKKLDLIYS
jgi:hypothetical protein